MTSGKSRYLSVIWFLSLHKGHKNNLLWLPLRGIMGTDRVNLYQSFSCRISAPQFVLGYILLAAFVQ